MTNDTQLAVLRGIVTGIIISFFVIVFLSVFGAQVYDAHVKLETIVSKHTQQEDLRFQQITNELVNIRQQFVAGENGRQRLENNQGLILASQETLTARIIEMRSKAIDCKREKELGVMQNMLIEHSLMERKK
jgi:hypothetical protein